MFEPEIVAGSADDIAWRNALLRGDKPQTTVICAGHQNHALTLDAAQFPWREVDQEGDLTADDVLRGEVLRDATDNCPGVEACVDSELQKLVGLGDLFAFQDGANAEVQFGEVVKGDFVFGRHEVAG